MPLVNIRHPRLRDFTTLLHCSNSNFVISLTLLPQKKSYRLLFPNLPGRSANETVRNYR